MADAPVVQTTEPVPEGQVSTPVTTIVTPEPSAEERMTTLISQKVAEEVAKAIELARREIQSAKDKATAEVQSLQRRARLAETTLTATQKQIQGLDPETQRELELAQLRAEREGRLSLEQEEQQARYQVEIVNRFHTQMTQFVTGLGVDPTDKRIDWAADDSNLLGKQGRILESVTKIQKENAKTAESVLEQKIKEAELRIKRDLGYNEANSVSTAASLGAVSEGIPTDMAKFREWIATVPQKEYETKYAAKVKEMMQQGKIK